MLKAYFDGSGKQDDPQSRFVTIAGFAADQYEWKYFDREWGALLRDRGNAPYMHMVEAIQHRGAFDGWDADRTNFLIQGLIGLLMEANQSRKFCGFQSTVDLTAHRKYATINNLPPVAVLCANTVFAKTLTWYADSADAIIGALDVFFDRGDPFLNVLMKQWNDKEIVEEQPWWKLVRILAPAEMQNVPALQAADMLAWSRNRLKTTGPNGWAGRLATDIQQGVERWTIDFDEAALVKRKYRNRNGFLT